MDETLDIDLDSVNLDDLDDDFADVDLTDFGEVDDSIDKPHIKVSSKAFREFLKVAKQICSSGGRDVISKAISMQVDGDKLVCRSTDFDVYVEATIDLLNDTNILQDNIQVQTDIMIKLCKAVPVNLVIFKDGEDYFIRLYGGDMLMETYTFPSEKYQFTENTDKIANISRDDMVSALKDLNPVVTAAVSPVERRIVCTKDCAIASYLWSILMVDKPFADFDLKVKDISVLRSILNDRKEDVLTVSITTDESSVKRCVISGDTFKYAFLVSDTGVSESMKTNSQQVLTDTGVYIDFVKFYKMVELAAELPYAIGKLSISYSEEGIDVEIPTKKGSSKFDLSGSVEGTIDISIEPLNVQAKLLRIVLRSFATKPTIKLSVTKMGLGIQADEYQAAVFTEQE